MVIDSEVLRLNPELPGAIASYARSCGPLLELVCQPVSVRGGEACKQDSSQVSLIQGLVEHYRLCRHSYLIAIGGGAVLDAVGYAAATAHRGVRLIRLPTTVLAQNDAGVGVKNGINGFGRKNFLGCFAPPFAVINDYRLLETLPERDLRAGIAEAVKVALVRDGAFFDRLFSCRGQLALFAPPIMEEMIRRCAELHLEHIAGSGDPFEFGSSRPLDFGHWAAHKLEELTGGELRHGEAVAIGIALDSLYSHRCGLLGKRDLRRILILLESLGFGLGHQALLWLDAASALAEFQEHLGGELSLPLLRGAGEQVEAEEIDLVLMQECIEELIDGVPLLERSCREGGGGHLVLVPGGGSPRPGKATAVGYAKA